MNTFSDCGDSVHAPKEKAINKSFILHVTQIAAGKKEKTCKSINHNPYETFK